MEALSIFSMGLFVCFYFVPTFVAVIRGIEWRPTFLVNLLLGWTVAGWFIAFVIAYKGRPSQQTINIR